MNFSDWIKNSIINWLGVQRLSGNPNAQRLSFISDEQNIRNDELDEYDAWFSGKGSELLNVYSNKSWYGYSSEPVYNRNNQNYFWSVSANESGIKRTHSGFPRDMVNAMSAKVGIAKIASSNPERNSKIERIYRSNDFGQLLLDTALPMSMVEGTGCFKPCFDRRLGKEPFLEFYKERDVEMIMRGRKNIGVVFKDYYQNDKGEDYLLCESRFAEYVPELNTGLTPLDNGYQSIIEYKLYKLSKKGNEIVPAKLSDVEDTKNLPESPLVIKGLDEPLAVPVVLFKDPIRDGYGVSVYANKLDVFDDLDQAYSEQSMTTRVSTPQEYFNAEYCERDANGNPIRPSSFARKYTMIDQPITDGNGNSTGGAPAVTATQPEMNIDQYSNEIDELKAEALGSFMSPATMGIGMAKKDNGDAQREKEKVTTASRDNIIASVTPCIKKAFGMLLMLEEYMDNNGAMSIPTYDDISVSFNEFSSPTMETKANVLTPMWTAKAISPKSFVEFLWSDTKSKDEKAEEIAYLEKVREDDKGKTPNMAPMKADEQGNRVSNENDSGIKADGQSYAGRSKAPSSAENAVKSD